MGRTSTGPGRVYDLCVYYMTGTPEGSTESGFMEKPGIEPATLGLQAIALIHYFTGASQSLIRQTGTIFAFLLKCILKLIKVKNMGGYLLIVLLASKIIRD